jgi:hypothetical protein
MVRMHPRRSRRLTMPRNDRIIDPMPVRMVVERGPKDKKAVAFAVDWPGWSRGAKTPELAVELLASYRERYRPVAVAAGMGNRFTREGARLEVAAVLLGVLRQGGGDRVCGIAEGPARRWP